MLVDAKVLLNAVDEASPFHDRARSWLEHGLSIVSADSDFARFPELVWVNPVAA